MSIRAPVKRSRVGIHDRPGRLLSGQASGSRKLCKVSRRSTLSVDARAFARCIASPTFPRPPRPSLSFAAGSENLESSASSSVRPSVSIPSERERQDGGTSTAHEPTCERAVATLHVARLADRRLAEPGGEPIDVVVRPLPPTRVPARRVGRAGRRALLRAAYVADRERARESGQEMEAVVDDGERIVTAEGTEQLHLWEQRRWWALSCCATVAPLAPADESRYDSRPERDHRRRRVGRRTDASSREWAAGSLCADPTFARIRGTRTWRRYQRTRPEGQCDQRARDRLRCGTRPSSEFLEHDARPADRRGGHGRRRR